jgi:hypothetical protein
MNLFQTICLKLSSLVKRRALKQEIDEELRFHNCASTRQRRRLVLDKSVKGNAAWTISPGRNMRILFSEPGIFPPRQNIVVAVKIWLFAEKIEGAAGFRKVGNLRAPRIIGIQRQHGQSSFRRQRPTCRQLQHTVGLDANLNRFHDHKIDCQRRIAKAQSSHPHNHCVS